jgi:3-dehydroquinate dehydratase II
MFKEHSIFLGVKAMMKILIVNGPNLNKLGQRESAIYGTNTLADLKDKLTSYASLEGFNVAFEQSNHEGHIIDWLHEADNTYDGVVLNAGAFTHYSYAIRDAITSINVPVVEVHISNIHAREQFRRESVLAPVCTGQITGFGFQSYILGCKALINLVEGEEDC